MIRIWWAAALLFSIVAGSPALAQATRTMPPDGVSPPAEIGALAWIAGEWVGEGLGAPAVEVYSRPRGGQIAGHFLMEDGTGGIRFYELLQIASEGGSLVYRLRHFNSDLTGWEDANGEAEQFRLVAIEPDAAYFDGLTLAREGEDGLVVTVRIAREDGTSFEAPFRYRRARD